MNFGLLSTNNIASHVVNFVRFCWMALSGKRKRGRPKRMFMDVVKEDMAEVEVTEEDTVDRHNRRRIIRCGDP